MKDGAPRVAGTLTIKQVITAKRIALAGTAAEQWEGIENSVEVGTSNCQISEEEVRDIVGPDGVPISLISANPPPQPNP